MPKTAVDIYSIPAMSSEPSSEPERVFPLAGTNYTATDKRCTLKSKSIEVFRCLKSWFQLKMFTEEDLHSIFSVVEDDALLDKDD